MYHFVWIGKYTSNSHVEELRAYHPETKEVVSKGCGTIISLSSLEEILDLVKSVGYGIIVEEPEWGYWKDEKMDKLVEIHGTLRMRWKSESKN